jgi:serine/threonine protein kinase
MEANAWRRIEELYHEASALAPGARARFLDETCAGDDALRAEVESLLGYESGADSFIDTSAFDVAARLMARHWSSDNPSLTGTTIGTFHVLEKLGEGGMGVVYEAEDTRLGRKVALKFLPAWIGSNPQARAGFEREARAASALNHPNICTIYSVQDHDGQPFIEMERLYGETLRDRLARHPLSIDEAVTLSDQVIDGLDAAHAKAIVHRDLKPGNIFCTARGAKILDFGIATVNAGQDERPGSIVGTASYMSPEQAAGRPVDARTDLFSLGVVMREMLPAGISKPLDRIIVKALHADRDRRYQSAAELRHDLARFRQRASTRRRRTLLGAALLFAILVVSIAFWYSPLNFVDRSDFRLTQLTHNASDYGVGSGAISPDGRYAVYEDPGGLHLLEIATGETRRMPWADTPPPGTRWQVPPAWLHPQLAQHRRRGRIRDLDRRSVGTTAKTSRRGRGHVGLT